MHIQTQLIMHLEIFKEIHTKTGRAPTTINPYDVNVEFKLKFYELTW